MSKNIISLIFATQMEAEPFIQGLALKEKEKIPFPVYANNHLQLIITGIGKVNAAMGCAYHILKTRTCKVINLGAAGATNEQYSLGECYHIAKVIEPDRPHLRTGTPYEHTPDIMQGFQSVTLATQDKIVLDLQARRAISAPLVDMEGAAVVQVCRHFQITCYLFKFVSDTPVHTQSKHISKNIKQYSKLFYTFFHEQVFPQIKTVL